MERSTVMWGTTSIPYTVRRSSRRSTVSIAVEPSGDVVVTAPSKASMGALDRAVYKKAKWIVERVRRRSSLPPSIEREFVSGETMLYLGRQCRLRVIAAHGGGPARLEHGTLLVVVPPGLGPAERASEVRTAVVAWYKHRAEERLPERVERWAGQLEMPAPRVLVRDQRLRWGSCDARGNIRLNWRIVQAPSRLIDYVVVHELVHTAHRDHDRAFWAAMAKAMPMYKAEKVRLLEYGPRLVW